MYWCSPITYLPTSLDPVFLCDTIFSRRVRGMHAAPTGSGPAHRPCGGGAHTARCGDHPGSLSHHGLVPGERVALSERSQLRVRGGPHHL